MTKTTNRKPTEIESILMRRDGMSADDARQALADARQCVLDGDDPSDVLQDEFGLEPDYVFDLLD